MRRDALLALLLLCSPLLPATDWTLYLNHAGPIRIGMLLPEVRRILGDPNAQLDSAGGEDALVCGYLKTNTLPEKFSIMFIYGQVARFDVGTSSIHTASGARIGDTEERIKMLYPGRILVEPHPYLFDTGHYLSFHGTSPADKDLGIVFETDNGKVTSFRTGTTKAISYIEGCA